MASNASPPPLFETDDERAAFVIRLPVHAGAHSTREVTTEVRRVVLASESRNACEDAGISEARSCSRPFPMARASPQPVAHGAQLADRAVELVRLGRELPPLEGKQRKTAVPTPREKIGRSPELRRR